MNEDFKRTMKNCIIRTVLNGKIIPNEVSIEFGCQYNITVIIFMNRIDFTDQQKLHSISIRDKDGDKYIGEFKVKSLILDEDNFTTVKFIKNE